MLLIARKERLRWEENRRREKSGVGKRKKSVRGRKNE